MKFFSKNFIQGFGSVMDIFPSTRYEIQPYSPEKSIEETLMDDWKKVEQSLYAGVARYEESLKNKSMT